MSVEKVFVTVGTTQFDKLVEAVSSEEILDLLSNLGYNFVQFQVGTGKLKDIKHPNIVVRYDRFFENFDEQLNNAQLVISHAGAGTCLEVLRKQIPLIVVINEDLMDNHQLELARQLEHDGYLKYCVLSELPKVLKNKDFCSLKSYPDRNTSTFNTYLNHCMGFG